MKKFISLLVCILCCSYGFAKSPLMSIKSGSLDILKEEVSINVVIEDFDPIIDGKNQGAKDYYTAQGGTAYSDFCADLKRGHESFISYYNEKRRVKSTLVKSPDAPYTLQVKVELMNVGNAGAAVMGFSYKAGGAVVNGKMLLVESATQKVVCEVEFNGIKGMRSPVFVGRAISVYRYLADALLKIVQQ